MIKSTRLKLVPVDYKYSDDLLEIWNDYEVIKYTYLNLLQSKKECNERIDMLINNTDLKFPDNFVVLLEGKAIGVAGYPIRKRDDFECGFYYHYGRNYWGNGYASEVANALKENIFSKYPNATIYAEAISVNLASIKILKNVGFYQTYIEEKGFQNNGMILDLLHFKLNSEFLLKT